MPNADGIRIAGDNNTLTIDLTLSPIQNLDDKFIFPGSGRQRAYTSNG